MDFRNCCFRIDQGDLQTRRAVLAVMRFFTLAGTGDKEVLPLITIAAQSPGKVNPSPLDERRAVHENGRMESLHYVCHSLLGCAVDLDQRAPRPASYPFR